MERFSLPHLRRAVVFLLFANHESEFVMSQHPSFKAGGAGKKKKRNVLKRFERISMMRRRGEWKTGESVMGLKKTLPDE